MFMMQAEPPAPARLNEIHIAYIAMEGFKTFLSPTFIPVDRCLTAIVAPNGLGKSCVSEAVACTLGHAGHDIRVRCAAEVITQKLKTERGDAAYCLTEVGFVIRAPQEQSLVRVSVRRTIFSNSRSVYAYCYGKDAITADTWMQKRMSDTSLADLRGKLSDYGVNLAAFSSCIVSQASLSIDAGDPISLLNTLEKLLGSWALKEKILACQTEEQNVRSSLDKLSERQGGLSAKRLSLRPHVEQLLAYHQAEELLQDQRCECAKTFLSEAVSLEKNLKSEERWWADARTSCKAQKVHLQQKTKEVVAQEELEHRQLTLLEQNSSACRMHVSRAERDLNTNIAMLHAEHKLYKANERIRVQLIARHKAAAGSLTEVEGEIKKLTSLKNNRRIEGATSQDTARLMLATNDNKHGFDTAWRGLVAARTAGVNARSRVAQATAQAAALAMNVKQAQATEKATSKCLEACQLALEKLLSVQSNMEHELKIVQRDIAVCDVEVASLTEDRQAAEQHVFWLSEQLKEEQQHTMNSSKMEKSLQHIHSMSNAGKLPGIFMGRICNCAEALPDMAEAVNTALRASINLKNTVVVSNRATALAVIDVMTRDRAWTTMGVQSLINGVQSGEGKLAALPVVQNLLGGFVLAPDWKTAQACADMQRCYQRQFSIVTRDLQVIKANGEVMRQRQGAGPGNFDVPKKCIEQRKAQFLESKIGQGGHDVLALAESQLQSVTSKCEERQTALQDLKSHCATSSDELKVICMDLERNKKTLQAKQNAQNRASSSLLVSQRSLQALQDDLKVLHADVDKVDEAYKSAVRDISTYLPIGEQQGCLALMDASYQATCEEQNLQDQINELMERKANVTNEISQLQCQLNAVDKRAIKATQLAANLQSAETEYNQKQKVFNATREKCDQQHCQLKAARECSDKARKREAKADKELSMMDASLHKLHEAVRRVNILTCQMTEWMRPEGLTQLEDAGTGILPSSSRTGQERKFDRRAALNRSPNARKARRRQMQTGHVSFGADDSSSCNELSCLQAECVLERKISCHIERIHASEIEAKGLYNNLNQQCIEEDVRAKIEMQEVDQELLVQEAKMESLRIQRLTLESQRFEIVNTGLCGVKGKLARVYEGLSHMEGDADLIYTPDKHLLFQQGVIMSVRPDGNAWRPFSQLSGGQQALSALALSFAAHSVSGSSWFLCDEVDAALDIPHAAKLGNFMRASSTQFIVVSHKAEVFEKASALVLLYQGANTTCACVVPVAPLKELLPAQERNAVAAPHTVQEADVVEALT